MVRLFTISYPSLLLVAEHSADLGLHPLHIHGHNVQLVARSPGVYSPQLAGGHKHQYLKTGVINTRANATALGFSNNTMSMPSVPVRRDTWMIAPNGYTVIRFRADNPGTWFLHCHMEWHMDAVSLYLCEFKFGVRYEERVMLMYCYQGLLLTLIEDPLSLQQQQPNIPSQMQSICKAQSIPLVGNAAGNSQNYTDLTGEIVVAPLEHGYVSSILFPWPLICGGCCCRKDVLSLQRLTRMQRCLSSIVENTIDMEPVRSDSCSCRPCVLSQTVE
jgi:iron transport multicopper oxidase